MDKPLIALLDSCKTSIIKKDIVALISLAKSFGLDNTSRSPLLDFIRNLIIEDIKDFMIQNKKDSIRISRKDVYHQETFDWYSLKDGELQRNGHTTKFDSIGKLYSAYKYIHETNLVSD
jgi:hypothetical protein